MRADIAIIGGGILGLAHAYIASREGRSVVLFERNPRATGASIRNFGMIWPIGQPAGEMHQLALKSQKLWIAALNEARLPYLATGSLHVVYRDDEADVAREFCEIGPQLGYSCEWLSREDVLRRSAAVRTENLLGGIWSSGELTVDPRQVVARLPMLLQERGVALRYGSAVRSIDLPTIEAGSETWQVDDAIVCSGDDFQTLYPKVFELSGLTRCKLQMLRTVPQPGGWQLGPALAAGLTLRFYKAFRACSTLPKLVERIARETPECDRWGIHALVSQTAAGEVTIGDSHEYGKCVDIFDKTEIDDLILREAATFLNIPSWQIAQRWHGVYSIHPDRAFFEAAPVPGVRIVTAPGGSGMTLSFGLAERTFQRT